MVVVCGGFRAITRGIAINIDVENHRKPRVSAPRESWSPTLTGGPRSGAWNENSRAAEGQPGRIGPTEAELLLNGCIPDATPAEGPLPKRHRGWPAFLPTVKGNGAHGDLSEEARKRHLALLQELLELADVGLRRAAHSPDQRRARQRVSFQAGGRYLPRMSRSGCGGAGHRPRHNPPE